MKLFEARKTIKLLEAVKGVELPKSNIWVQGASRDTNGNKTVVFNFVNDRAFSIQVYGNSMKKSLDLIQGVKKVEDLKDSDLKIIRDEVADYIKKYGSSAQKSKMKLYEAGNNPDAIKEAGFDKNFDIGQEAIKNKWQGIMEIDPANKAKYAKERNGELADHFNKVLAISMDKLRKEGKV